MGNFPKKVAKNILGAKIQKPQPFLVYLVMRGVTAFAFSLIITYELVYHTTVLGLNPIQLVTLGVILETVQFLFEIPTGMVADLYSRRLSVLIGIVLTGLGFLAEGVMATLPAAWVAQLLWGLGFTFYSGAAEAWIGGEVDEQMAQQAYLRGAQIRQIMSLCGVAVGAFIVTYGLQWPIIIGAVIYLGLAILLVLMMTEVGFSPHLEEGEPSLWHKMISPIKEGVIQLKIRPVLAIIMGVGIVIGLSLGGFDRLNAAHILENFNFPEFGSFSPVAWFSIISGITAILSFLGAEIVRRYLKTNDNKQIANILFWLYGGMIVFTLIFALNRWFYLAIASFCISQSFRNTGRPLLIIWISQNTPSAIRATTISMYWQSNAFGNIVGSPIIGWIGSAFSIKAAMTAVGVIYSAVLPLIYLGGHQKYAEDLDPQGK
ncbi:MAG: MFS transporter [Anaerolineae bacterium]